MLLNREVPLVVRFRLVALLEGATDLLSCQIDNMHHTICRASQDDRLVSTRDILDGGDQLVMDSSLLHDGFDASFLHIKQGHGHVIRDLSLFAVAIAV